MVLAMAALALGTGCASTPSAARPGRRAEAAAEETPAMLLDRGKAFVALGDPTRGEQYLAAALAHGADDRVVLPLLVRVCVQDGRYRAAAMYTDEFARKHPDDARSRVLAGLLHDAVGDGVRARESLEQAVTLAPNDTEARFALAGVLARAGDSAAADAQRLAFLALAPDDPRAPEVRSQLLQTVPAGS